MDNRPVGVMDSGIGGLTAVRQIARELPGEDIIYFGDLGRMPYGTRTAETIIKYTRQDIRFLMSFHIKAIVIACGTASSAALSTVSPELELPVVGVVRPASIAAAAATRSGKIGILGTAGTIKSGSYIRELLSINPSLQFKTRACPMFVPLVENGYTDPGCCVTRLIAEEYLEEIRTFGCDTVILGCTHFPLLAPIIADVLGPEVTLIDSGAAAAGALRETLTAADALCDRREGTLHCFVSDDSDTFARLGSAFLDRKIDNDIVKINIENY